MATEVSESLDVVHETIKLGQRAIHELAEIRATLLVNFGEGRSLSHRCNLGDGKDESTQHLMIRVLESLAFSADVKQEEPPDESTVAIDSGSIPTEP